MILIQHVYSPRSSNTLQHMNKKSKKVYNHDHTWANNMLLSTNVYHSNV